MDKSILYDTGFSYCPSVVNQQPSINTSRVASNLDKENVVPCAAQLQSLIMTLNQKKHQLKNVLLEKQKLTEISTEQSAKLDSENIKQTYLMEMETNLHEIGMRNLEDVEALKREKLKNLEKMLGLKRALEQRFEQIVDMKKLVTELQTQKTETQAAIQEVQSQNRSIEYQTSELQLMSQNLDNEVLHMRQAIRQNEVMKQTGQTASNQVKFHIQQTLTSIKQQNKLTRAVTLALTQTQSRISKLREQKAEQDINSSQLQIRNRHIEDTNIKLRSDLEKCKGHLICLMKNNQLLTNSIEEFTYVDERVSKIIRKNQLKNL